MRTTVPNYDAFFEIVPKMGEYMDSVGAVCRMPEYCFTIFHNDEYREEDIDVEICEAVVEPKAESETVRFRTVNGVPIAACINHPRESYIDGIWNMENPADWLTEVQVPVRFVEDR